MPTHILKQPLFSTTQSFGRDISEGFLTVGTQVQELGRVKRFCPATCSTYVEVKFLATNGGGRSTEVALASEFDLAIAEPAHPVIDMGLPLEAHTDAELRYLADETAACPLFASSTEDDGGLTGDEIARAEYSFAVGG